MLAINFPPHLVHIQVAVWNDNCQQQWKSQTCSLSMRKMSVSAATFPHVFKTHLMKKTNKTINLTFDHNFGKCKLIFKSLSFTVRFLRKFCTHTLSICFYTTWWKFKSTDAANFNGVLHVRSQNSSCQKWYCSNSSDLNPMTIKSGKQGSSAQKRIREVSKLKQWMTDV